MLQLLEQRLFSIKVFELKSTYHYRDGSIDDLV